MQPRLSRKPRLMLISTTYLEREEYEEQVALKAEQKEHEEEQEEQNNKTKNGI